MTLPSFLTIFGFIVCGLSFIVVVMSLFSDGSNGIAIIYAIMAFLNGLIAVALAEVLQEVREKKQLS